MKTAILCLLTILCWPDSAWTAGAANAPATEAQFIKDLKIAKDWFDKECNAVARGDVPSTLPASESMPEFHKALLKVAGAFPLLDPRALPATNRFFPLKLNARGAGVDGFRFRNTSTEAKNLGWMFARERPSDLTHWYIARADNVPMEGFNDFFRPRIAYANAPWGSRDFQVTLQWLRNGALEPNVEYVIWFAFQGTKPIDAFVGLDLFPATDQYESRGLIEQALGLKARPAQVAATPPGAAPARPPGRTGPRKDAVQFETTSASVFAVQSRFTGSAVVTGDVVKVQVDSGVLSFPANGREGDSRTIAEYRVALAMNIPGTWERISQSEAVKVQQDLKFGQEIRVPAATLTIPLASVSDYTNHWLVFDIKHVSANRPQGGHTYSHSRKDLFEDLPVNPEASEARARQRSAVNTMFAMSPQTAFAVENWDHFPVVKLLAATNNTETMFQDFYANDHVVGEFEGRRYTGVRFSLPHWLDGDFEYAFVHAYQNAREQRERGGYSWQITTESGLVPVMGNTDRVPFNELPETRARFPFTEKGYTGAVKRQFLTPGQTYLFWWSYTKPVLPDMALALSVASDRGRKEYGEIKWR